MSVSDLVKNLCENLGKKNKATYVMVSVAVAKGIFRPVFTMSDKKESVETRKATALREGLTELIAIPVYLAVDGIVRSVVKKIVPKNAPDIKGIKATRLAETNLNLLGICFAGGIIIPAICFLVQRNLMGKKDKNKAPEVSSNNNLNIVSNSENIGIRQYHLSDVKNISQQNGTVYKTPMATFMNSKMRVG